MTEDKCDRKSIRLVCENGFYDRSQTGLFLVEVIYQQDIFQVQKIPHALATRVIEDKMLKEQGIIDRVFCVVVSVGEGKD